MIRVLHILHSMNRGGAEAMLMNYYRNIDRTRVQFDFLLTEQKHCQYEDEIESLGGRVFRVPLLTITRPWPYVNEVRHFLKNHREYTIVHSHTSSKSVIPLWVAKRCGVPVRIAHSHNNQSERGWTGLIRNLLKFPLKSVATNFFACGAEAAAWLFGNGVQKIGRVQIVRNAIDLNRFLFVASMRDEIRQKLEAPPRTFLLGIVARFNRQKNHLFALDVLHALKERGCSAKLLFVGDGELRAAIEQKRDRLGLQDDVVMTGLVSDVHRYLSAMDVVLMPSFNEGLPVSLIEAQANGLPVVASQGVPHEVDVTGNVDFLPLDVEAWADCLADKIAKGLQRDDAAVEKVRKAGYDIQTASKQLEEWYVTQYNRYHQ